MDKDHAPQPPISEAAERQYLQVGPELPPVLTVDELADFLRVNAKTAYEAIRKGQIPGVVRVSGSLRINRDAVLEWLRNGQAPATNAHRRIR